MESWATGGLVGAVHAVEHYEIAHYGTLIAWAEQLGKSGIVKLLNETLKRRWRRMKRFPV